MQLYQDILRFWFPILPKGDRAAIVSQWEWWFRSGADADITRASVQTSGNNRQVRSSSSS